MHRILWVRTDPGWSCGCFWGARLSETSKINLVHPVRSLWGHPVTQPIVWSLPDPVRTHNILCIKKGEKKREKFVKKKNAYMKTKSCLKLIQKQWKVTIFETPNPEIWRLSRVWNWSKNSDFWEFLFISFKTPRGHSAVTPLLPRGNLPQDWSHTDMDLKRSNTQRT